MPTSARRYAPFLRKSSVKTMVSNGSMWASPPQRLFVRREKRKNYFSGGSGGKGDAHVGSLAVDGVDFDLALVLRENLAGDGKTKTCAARLAAPGFYRRGRNRSKTRQIFFGNADAVIRHADEDFPLGSRKFRFCRRRGYT